MKLHKKPSEIYSIRLLANLINPNVHSILNPSKDIKFFFDPSSDEKKKIEQNST